MGESTRVICIGSAERVRPIAAQVRALGVEVVRASDGNEALQQINAVTGALTVVPPIGGFSVGKLCQRLREGLGPRAVPVLVVLRQPMTPREQGALYWKGAAGVFDWPRDRLSFLRIVARVAIVGKAGRPLKRDEQLTRAARKRLREHPADLGKSLSAFVIRGVAVLEGHLHALWKLDAAEAALAALQGVEDVITHGVTVADSGMSDRSIANAVRAVLRSAAGIDLSTVAVRVAAGKVTISGEAGDRRELKRLVRLVRHVNGVRGIENLVTISPGKKARDSYVARELSREVAHQLPDAKVQVSVFGGLAVLEGRVRRAADRRVIEGLAEEQTFVERVLNKVEAIRGPSSSA